MTGAILKAEEMDVNVVTDNELNEEPETPTVTFKYTPDSRSYYKQFKYDPDDSDYKDNVPVPAFYDSKSPSPDTSKSMTFTYNNKGTYV